MVHFPNIPDFVVYIIQVILIEGYFGKSDVLLYDYGRKIRVHPTSAVYA